jgi:predicted component of type VI protein secretion system
MKYQYFSLNQSGAAWDAVTRARNLAAHVPGDFPKSANGVAYPAAAGGPMKLLNKPVWAEGMYLGPHNFQAQSRYFEDSLNFVTTSLWRDAYGFAGLQFDDDALRNGTLALTNGRGLFEDGLAFDLPGSDSAPPPREFGALFSPVADHLTMHLAVPVSSRRAAIQASTMARPLPFAITAGAGASG